jgi:hypothetical protein
MSVLTLAAGSVGAAAASEAAAAAAATAAGCALLGQEICLEPL